MLPRAALAIALLLSGAAHAQGPAPAQVSTCFSPGPADCTKALVAAIDGAQASVWMQAHWLSYVPFLDALAAAKQRGVDVRVILDRTQGRGPSPNTKFLAGAAIPIWIDAVPGMAPSDAHNRVVIVDAATVITIDMHFSPAKTNPDPSVILIESSESGEVISSAATVATYVRNWTARQAVSRVFEAE